MILDQQLRAEITTDLLVRKEIGVRNYGVVLDATCQNLPLQDAYEEALDCLLYVRQAIAQKHVKQLNQPIVDMVIADTLDVTDLEDVYQNLLQIVCSLKRMLTNEQISD